VSVDELLLNAWGIEVLPNPVDLIGKLPWVSCVLPPGESQDIGLPTEEM
jgi:hypothetical protein